MRYLSTRGLDAPRTFGAVVLDGLARDGGLYVPEDYPDVTAELDKWSELSYQDLAVEVMTPFVAPDLSPETLRQLVTRAYRRFDHAEVTPLASLSECDILELFHGPTLAFKDVALQFLGELFSELLHRQGRRMTIIGATSGDTGSAAIEGVRGRKGISIFMLHPKGRVSRVQALQMTTVLDDNVYNLAVSGDFDDCQGLVKSLFNDHAFRDRYSLGAVNSINWARILAQTVYYFYAGLKRLRQRPNTPLTFVVPTGNFGDILAGYIARRMGLPVAKLVIATNHNDILVRVLRTGAYVPEQTRPSLSPAMDIQVSSNFERVLFDVAQRDGAKVREWMMGLNAGGFQLGDSELTQLREIFEAVRVDDEEIIATIRETYAQDRYVLDPHTAVGVTAAKKLGIKDAVCLATAHPAKFPEAVERAIGSPPPTPERIRTLFDLPTRQYDLPASVNALKTFIAEALEESRK
ncbi:MAG: threonine synthase [Gammaproteobacteria bacterium]|nr:MAG: threonine synthase [Gammaproteobacteria bacterium]